MQKKIFITGGAGFIGSNCANFFLKKNFKVFILDNIIRKSSIINFNNLKKNKNVIAHRGDTKNYKKLENLILKFKPNLIINCAGQVAVTTSIIKPKQDLESNVIGTFNLLEILRVNNLKTKMIHLSTNKVYGDLENKKIYQNKKRYYFKKSFSGFDEKTNLNFHSPYGCSKGAADQYVIDYRRIYGLNTYNIRQSCIYGPLQYGIEDQGWVAWLILCAIKDKKINIFGTGKQVRDILHVEDLTKLFYRIFLNKSKKIDGYYNCGGGLKNSISILELIDIIESIKKNKVSMQFKPKRKSDQKIFISNNKKLLNTFNWRPNINKFDGIKKLYKWIYKNKKNFKRFYK